jgi:hypothetical protein
MHQNYEQACTKSSNDNTCKIKQNRCVCAWLWDECMYSVWGRFEKLIRACVVICLIGIDFKIKLW